jgi:type IV pilus assembly protein PilC
MRATTCFQRARAVGVRGLKRRKVKLEPFLIFNQQFLDADPGRAADSGQLADAGQEPEERAFRRPTGRCIGRVKTGEALSAAFEAQSGFPVMYTTTLLAGERSGNLLEVLERYVSFQRVSLTFRKKLITSLIYPCVLMTLVTGLVMFMFAYVVPQFALLYDQLGSKLPAMTVYLLGFGKWLNHNLLWILLAGWRVAAAIYRSATTERGRDFVDGFRDPNAGLRQDLAQVPGGAVCAHAVNAADGRTAAGAVAGDGGAVDLFAAGFEGGVASITTVREGKSLAEALVQHKVFPDLAAEMITVGEQTGALPQMLNSVAEFFEEDVATALTAALALIEPAF